MKKQLFIFALLVMGIIFLCTAASAQVIKWRIQTAVPTASIYYELLKMFGDRVEKMSGGRLKTEVLPDGAVVQAFEILDAVSKGVIEGGYAWTHYWSGKHPAALLFSAPGGGSGAGLDQISHMAWLHHGGGNELYKAFYKDVLKVNIEAFMLQPMGPDPLGWFKHPIKNMEEFKKLKYRSPPGIPGEIFKEMGVSAVSMAGGEIVPAAQKGVIDAAEWISPADDMNLGLHTVWKYYYLQGIHQATDVGEIIINGDFWKKLTPDLQEIIKGAVMASIADTYDFNVYKNALAVKTLQEKHGVQILDTPQDVYPAYLEAASRIYDKYAAKDAFFKKVLDSQREFAKLVVPYWTKILELYKIMGETALKKK